MHRSSVSSPAITLCPTARPTTFARTKIEASWIAFAARTPSQGMGHFRGSSKDVISWRPSPSLPPLAVPATLTIMFPKKPTKIPMP